MRMFDLVERPVRFANGSSNLFLIRGFVYVFRLNIRGARLLCSGFHWQPYEFVPASFGSSVGLTIVFAYRRWSAVEHLARRAFEAVCFVSAKLILISDAAVLGPRLRDGGEP